MIFSIQCSHLLAIVLHNVSSRHLNQGPLILDSVLPCGGHPRRVSHEVPGVDTPLAGRPIAISSPVVSGPVIKILGSNGPANIIENMKV